MPTTGWFCQTGGNARLRVTQNTSAIATEGVYNVKWLRRIKVVDQPYLSFQEHSRFLTPNPRRDVLEYQSYLVYAPLPMTLFPPLFFGSEILR